MIYDAARILVCAIAIAAPTGTAVAQRDYGDRTLELAGAQTAITQRLAKETLLVALNIDRERSLRNLQTTHARFGLVLRGLRDGDPMLGLPPAASAALIEELDDADRLWSQMESEIQSGLAGRAFTPDQVGLIASLSLPLLDTMEDAVAAYAGENPNGRLFSLLVVAIEMSHRQRTLVELMAKELLLIAYGRDVEQNRAQLRQTAAQFDETLDGLINGDLDRLLLPAPTAEIRDQLAEVERIWQAELAPIVQLAIAGDPINRGTISRVAEIDIRLSQASSQVVALYQLL